MNVKNQINFEGLEEEAASSIEKIIAEEKGQEKIEKTQKMLFSKRPLLPDKAYNFSCFPALLKYIEELPLALKEKSAFKIMSQDLIEEYKTLVFILKNELAKDAYVSIDISVDILESASYEARSIINERNLTYALESLGAFKSENIEFKDWHWWVYLCAFYRLEKRVFECDRLTKNSIIYTQFKIINPVETIEKLSAEWELKNPDFLRYYNEYKKNKLPPRGYDEAKIKEKAKMMEGADISIEQLRWYFETALNYKERDVLRLRFGLAKEQTPLTLEQIANMANVTPEAIRQREIKALRKLGLTKRQFRVKFLGKESYLAKDIDPIVVIKGIAKNLSEWLTLKELTKSCLYYRMNKLGMTLQQALTHEKHKRYKGNNLYELSTQVTIGKETYSVEEWLKKSNIAYSTFVHRLRTMSVEQALSTKNKRRK